MSVVMGLNCTQTVQTGFNCGCNRGYVLNSDGATCNSEYYVKHTHNYVQRKEYNMYEYTKSYIHF